METKKQKIELHVRVKADESRKDSQEEIRRRLKDLFLLLYEIDQENNVSKEYQDEQAE